MYSARNSGTPGRPHQPAGPDAGWPSSSGRSRSRTGAERPITKDATGCFNITTAIELALRASWLVREHARGGNLEAGCSVRIGAGIAFGSKTVCGYLSTGSSAHRWSVFGDGATEAQSLANQGPGVRISSRALERL